MHRGDVMDYVRVMQYYHPASYHISLAGRCQRNPFSLDNLNERTQEKEPGDNNRGNLSYLTVGAVAIAVGLGLALASAQSSCTHYSQS